MPGRAARRSAALRPALCLLLCAFAAHAQDVDRCPAGARPLASIQSVDEAWAAGLAGEEHPEKKLRVEGGYRCSDASKLSQTMYPNLLGCTQDGAFAVVDVGPCQGSKLKVRPSCGVAVVDMKRGVFSGFLRAADAPLIQAELFGNSLARTTPDGLELRFGKNLKSSTWLRHARVVSATDAPDLLLLSLRSDQAERLASYRVGAKDPTFLSPAFEELRFLDLVPGTSRFIAGLDLRAGPGFLLVGDYGSGKQLFNVKGAFRHTLSATGQVLVSVGEETTGTVTRLFVERDAQGKRPERVSSGIPFTSAVVVAAAFQTGRVALGGPGKIELFKSGPLEKTAVLSPFGEDSKMSIDALRWLEDGQRLLASASGYLPDGSKIRNAVVLIDAADGQVLQTWPDAILVGDGELRLQQGTRLLVVDADGGTRDAPPVTPGVVMDPAADCRASANALVLELSLTSGAGVLIPIPRR